MPVIFLAHASERFEKLDDIPSLEPFGGKNCVIAGDLNQMPPVNAIAIAKSLDL
jgi:hypothetical protein